MKGELLYVQVRPQKALSDFVESFWMLHNPSEEEKECIILPDGRIDLFFSVSATEPFHITLLGLGTHAEQARIGPQTKTFAISFKLLATEYVFHDSLSNLLDQAKNLPNDFWSFSVSDLENFEAFCKKASLQVQSQLFKSIDSRKQRLFELIHASHGSISVHELSEKVFWSSRQINRYFNQQYGISLKSYCNILRFRASFKHIKEGKLFPEQDYSDQSHFIKEIKRLSGVLPKELSKNRNDRFIQFSTLGMP